MDSSAGFFLLNYLWSLVAPDRTSSIFSLRQMPTALMSIGLKPSCREPTAAQAVLKSLTQAPDHPSQPTRSRSADTALSGRRAAPHHSITSSASASSGGGGFGARALGGVWVVKNSKLVDCI